MHCLRRYLQFFRSGNLSFEENHASACFECIYVRLEMRNDKVLEEKSNQMRLFLKYLLRLDSAPLCVVSYIICAFLLLRY